MKLDLAAVRAITLGAVRIDENEKGFTFHRFTEEQEALYREKRPERQFVRCFFTAGIRFSFVTDSEILSLKGTLSTPFSERLL